MARPNLLTSLLILLASVGLFLAAAGNSWAVTSVRPPTFFGPSTAPPERARIGLSGVELGSASYSFRGKLCGALPECLALRDAADRAHATLVASAAALLVAALVYEAARAAALLPPAMRAFYALRGETLTRGRLVAVALTLLVATGVSLASAANFARVGYRVADALEGAALDPLGALTGGGGGGGPGGAAAAIPWADIPWASLFPPSDGKNPPTAAALAARHRLAVARAPRESAARGAAGVPAEARASLAVAKVAGSEDFVWAEGVRAPAAAPGAASSSDADWVSAAAAQVAQKLNSANAGAGGNGTATPAPDGGGVSADDVLAAAAKALGIEPGGGGGAGAADGALSGAIAAALRGLTAPDGPAEGLAAAASDAVPATGAAGDRPSGGAGKARAGADGVPSGARAAAAAAAPPPSQVSAAAAAAAPPLDSQERSALRQVQPGRHAYVLGGAALCALGAALLLLAELHQTASEEEAWPDAHDAHTAFLTGALRV